MAQETRLVKAPRYVHWIFPVKAPRYVHWIFPMPGIGAIQARCVTALQHCDTVIRHTSNIKGLAAR